MRFHSSRVSLFLVSVLLCGFGLLYFRLLLFEILGWVSSFWVSLLLVSDLLGFLYSRDMGLLLGFSLSSFSLLICFNLPQSNWSNGVSLLLSFGLLGFWSSWVSLFFLGFRLLIFGFRSFEYALLNIRLLSFNLHIMFRSSWVSVTYRVFTILFGFALLIGFRTFIRFRSSSY